MKKLILIILVFLLTAPVIKVLAETEENEFLPIGLTQEEMLRLDEIGINHKVTFPPTGNLRNCAEWEPSEGVIIRWPLGISISIVAELSEDVMVTTIVGSSSEETSARSSYTSGGVNMANTQFIIAPTNSIWTRDYGPWFIFEDNRMAIVDHEYNRPRPQDDVIPQVIGAEWGMNVYGMDLEHTGGNHMSDGLGMSISTELVYNENPGITEAEVDSIMLEYLGNDYTVLDYIESGGIHHIDCWAKFLNPTTILVKDVPSGSSSYALLNARAEYLSQQMSPWGRPYTVVRIYCPYGTAYTNSLILNDKVFVPIFSNSYDDAAIQTYEDGMPGYEVIGFYGSWYDNDAIHCRTMGVPDREMLFVEHVPLPDVVGAAPEGYDISVTITACSGMPLIGDSLKVIYSVDDGAWVYAPLSVGHTSVDPCTGTIPAQAPGSQIRYYIQAADNSGRVETRPYIGASWAHEFTVNMAPEIVSDDSLVCKEGSLFEFYPQFIDDDDTIHVITYSNYSGWMTVQNDSLVGTAPDQREVVVFSVEVADQYSSDTMDIQLIAYLCGDPSADGSVNLTDILDMISHIYGNPPGSAPDPEMSGDVNADGQLNLTDILDLISHIYGDPPLELNCP